MSYTAKARKGAELLDTHNPGWFRHVSLKTLDMRSIDKCIVGQVYGDWGRGMDELDHTFDNSDWRKLQADYGFDLPEEDYEDACFDWNENWAALQSAWIEEIMKRTNDND
jgi:hypothetical protein